ncbi:hypothetical protein PIB30_070463, partial [Stylosanthes scabra]|nr:hypothetical protein [Stylosanthes scabra]
GRKIQDDGIVLERTKEVYSCRNNREGRRRVTNDGPPGGGDASSWSFRRMFEEAMRPSNALRGRGGR